MALTKEQIRDIAAKLPVLRYGSRGWYVEELQRMLNKLGYALKVDGIFGRRTLAAVRDFQRKNFLVVDGIVGINTWSKLMEKTGIYQLIKPPVKPAPKPKPPQVKAPPIPETKPKKEENFIMKNLPIILIGLGVATLFLLPNKK